MSIETEIHGVVFSTVERPYDFKNSTGERIQGVTHAATILDLQRRVIHEVKFKGPDGQHAHAALKNDDEVALRCDVRANNNKTELVFAGYVKPVAAAKSA